MFLLIPIMSLWQGHWDLTNGDFQGCDKPGMELPGVLTNKEGKRAQAKESEAEERPGVGEIVVVSPVRKPLVKDAPYWRQAVCYGEQFKGTVSFLQATVNYGQSIRHLHIHRAPFFDAKVFGLLLSEGNMPMLQTLGVYRCELLHFGSTVALLDACSKRRDQGYPLESFDFYPRFHEGPNDNRRFGSFGVSWSDSGVHTAKAIFGWLLYRILPKAEELGFDLISRSSSFRTWLEKLPLPWRSVPRVLDLYLRRRDTPAEDRTDETELEYAHQLLALAALPLTFVREPAKGWNRPKPCDTCKTPTPPMFMRTFESTTCAGCWLKGYCFDEEDDHYKLNKQSIVDNWLWWQAQRVKVRVRARVPKEEDEVSTSTTTSAATSPAMSTASLATTVATTSTVTSAGPSTPASLARSVTAVSTSSSAAAAVEPQYLPVQITARYIELISEAVRPRDADEEGGHPTYGLLYLSQARFAHHLATVLTDMRHCNEVLNKDYTQAVNVPKTPFPISSKGMWERDCPQRKNEYDHRHGLVTSRTLNLTGVSGNAGLYYWRGADWDEVRDRPAPDLTTTQPSDVHRDFEQHAPWRKNRWLLTRLDAKQRWPPLADGDDGTPRRGREERRGGACQEGPPGQGPAEQGTTEQGTPEQRPAEKGPAEQRPAEQRPAEKGPAEQGTTEQGTPEQRPAEQGPAEQRPAGQRPAEKGPAEQGTPEQRPAEKGPAGQRPAGQRPAGQRPAEKGPAEQRPAEQRPAEQRPAEQRPAERGPRGYDEKAGRLLVSMACRPAGETKLDCWPR